MGVWGNRESRKLPRWSLARSPSRKQFLDILCDLYACRHYVSIIPNKTSLEGSKSKFTETEGNPETTLVCWVRVLKECKPDWDWVSICSVDATDIATPLYITVKRKMTSQISLASTRSHVLSLARWKNLARSRSPRFSLAAARSHLQV